MSQEALVPDYHFLEQIEAAGPFRASACFQCRKCSNGCPVTFAMDLYPDEVIRMVILGQKEMVLPLIPIERQRVQRTLSEAMVQELLAEENAADSDQPTAK